MAKQKTEEEPKPQEPPKPVEGMVVEVVNSNINDLFHRKANGVGPTRTLTMRRVLTRPLVSMAKRKQLAVECQSEMYVIELPLTGRGGGMSSLRVFDGIELVPTETGFVNGDECIVIAHEIMCSALHKAGFASMADIQENGAHVRYDALSGRELKGTLLGFIAGDIADGKRYRAISVAELE